MRENREPILTLGPALFLWREAEWRDFYFRIADEAPVDIVFLGEVVCSKRRHFFESHFSDVVERLERAGKRLALSSLALATQPREIEMNRAIAAQNDFPVEANDLSLLPNLSGKPHSVGPFVNVYNSLTAAFLTDRGAQSICLPPELPLVSIAAIAESASGAAVEVFAFGRAPLAISARCAHARAKGKSKDDCQFACGQEPDGLLVKTMSGQSFFAINGVQTMSHTYHSAMSGMNALLGVGVRRFRLSPQRTDMVRIAEIHREVLCGKIDEQEGCIRLASLCPNTPISNGFLHGAAGADFISGSPGSNIDEAQSQQRRTV